MKPELFPQKNLSRRTLLQALATVSLIGCGAFGLPACTIGGPDSEPDTSGAGLGVLAGRKKRLYGAAVQSWQLDDGDFADALRREVRMLVPENELKWDKAHPAPDRFDFSGYNRIASFAQANDMKMRGHTLLWHYANPPWLEPALENRARAEKILETHIARMIGETAPIIRNWDVVNEAVDPHSPRADGLRETLWLKALGPDYVAHAYRLAHEADPGFSLVYNDYGMERGDANGHRKRHCILRLLEKCLHRKAPVHALGLQSHLQAHRPLAGREFTAFLKEVRDLGLKIYITELDLDVSKLVGRTDDKITLAQNYVRAYLDMVQKDGAVEMLLTWGLSDRYTWLRETQPDIAGALPLEADLDRGELWKTLKKRWALL